MLPSVFVLLSRPFLSARDVDSSCLPIDVALLERHPLAGLQSRRGREEHRRPVARAKPRGELVELSP